MEANPLNINILVGLSRDSEEVRSSFCVFHQAILSWGRGRYVNRILRNPWTIPGLSCFMYSVVQWCFLRSPSTNIDPKIFTMQYLISADVVCGETCKDNGSEIQSMWTLLRRNCKLTSETPRLPYEHRHFFANKAKTEMRHFCLKHYKTRCTPVKRDRIKNLRHGQHPERDQNEIGICIM